jgi:hypothetical protein
MFPRSIPTPISKSPVIIPIKENVCKPICVKCKYYLPPPHGIKDLKFGSCSKIGYINLIDGEITYEGVQIAREYHCKGEMYEEINDSYKTFLQ